jgi:hypothetical protein
VSPPSSSRLASAFADAGWDAEEAERLVTLVRHLCDRPTPPSPLGQLLPDHERLRDGLARAVETDDPEEVESRLLQLYAHVHMNEAPYSGEERRRMDAAGGYWNHAGGLSPILKAAPWVGEGDVSVDFGAGNGLQGLLLQVLAPHARTVQIEICARMEDIGQALREWLGVPRERVEWVIDDVRNVPATGYDLIYLYRPVRPDGPGRDFYVRFAREAESEPRPPLIFSVADCLRGFLSDRYEVFYGDGHLTCFRPSASLLSDGGSPRRRGPHAEAIWTERTSPGRQRTRISMGRQHTGQSST